MLLLPVPVLAFAAADGVDADDPIPRLPGEGAASFCRSFWPKRRGAVVEEEEEEDVRSAFVAADPVVLLLPNSAAAGMLKRSSLTGAGADAGAVVVVVGVVVTLLLPGWGASVCLHFKERPVRPVVKAQRPCQGLVKV